jgi:NADH dehydrogenase (ubiquinone) 1 alpha subcomplex subunit 8
MWQCRRSERRLNKCVFEKIVRFLLSIEDDANILQGLEKVIPDAPKGEIPIHLRDKQLFADRVKVLLPWEKDVDVRKDSADS